MTQYVSGIPSAVQREVANWPECAAGLARLMSPADYNDRGNQNADVIEYLAKANGRFGALVGTLGRVPSPYALIVR